MKAYVLSGAIVAALFGGAAQAQEFQAIAQELYDQGFENQATIRVRSDGLYVETSGSAGTTERVYSLDGTVLREEETITSDGRKIERDYDDAGNLIEEEIKTAQSGKRSNGAVIEQVYSQTGTLEREVISTPGGTRIERNYDAAGNVVSNEVSRERTDRSRGRSEGRNDRDKADRAEEKGDDAARGDRAGGRGGDDRAGGNNGQGRGRG